MTTDSSIHLHRVVLWLAMILSLLFAFWRMQPPSRDANGFSTPKALEHLRFIASETRPVGSPHHQAVRNYLTTQFQELGYDVQFQAARSPIPLENVLARKAGTAPGNKAVMLVAHYDSVRTGPGAGDDGAAVAALLEVARIFSTQMHRDDIIFLISDGEELGLWGARTFVEQPHAWLADVGAVLNFDARGSCGPSIMFETSSGNGWLIDLYAKTVSHPFCSSISYDIYKRMKNNTDFTPLRDVGQLQGLNFAFIDGVENYHQPSDDLEHLDERSLRHHGLQALSMATALSNVDLSELPHTPNQVYFSIASMGIVHYPMSLAVPIALIVTLFAAGTIVYGLRRRLISLAGMMIAVACFLLNAAAVGGVAELLGRLDVQATFGGNVDRTIALHATFAVVLTIQAMIAAYRVSAFNLAAAGLLVGIPPAIGASIIMPGGSYLTAFPLLLASIGVAVCLTDWASRRSATRTIVLAVIACCIIQILAPMVFLAFLALGTKMAFLLVLPIVAAMWLLPFQIRYPRYLPTGATPNAAT